jgi:hypothetical protein
LDYSIPDALLDASEVKQEHFMNVESLEKYMISAKGSAAPQAHFGRRSIGLSQKTPNRQQQPDRTLMFP